MRYVQPPDSGPRIARQRARAAGAMVAALAVTATATAIVGAPPATADAVAYLVNVTVRPGYGFPNAEAALAYGHELCDRVRSGMPYGTLISNVKRYLHTTDDYHAAYLINQAANELCPGAIWQLRSSAVGYQSGSE